MNYSKKLPPMPMRNIPRIPSAIQKRLNQDNQLMQVLPKPLSRQSIQLIEIENENQQNLYKRYKKQSIQKLISSRCRSSKNYSSSKSLSDKQKSIQKLSKHLISGLLIANLPYITAKSWAIFQISSNKFLYGKKQDIRRQVASLTKISNLITILQILSQNNLDPQRIKVTITKQSSSMIGTTSMIKQGMTFTLKNLFYGMMLPSGNDSAYQIAQVGGAILNLVKDNQDPSKFVYDKTVLSWLMDKYNNNVIVYLNKMNQIAKFKAKTISTSFANPHGLSNVNSLSTAEDMARLSAYAMRNQKFRQVVQTKVYSCKYQPSPIQLKQSQNKITSLNSIPNDQNLNPNIPSLQPISTTKSSQSILSLSSQKQPTIISWQNTNKMLWRGWSGIKTGITPNAGPCLSASIKKVINQKQYQFVIILLKSYSMETRWKEVQGLAEWAQELIKQQ